MMSQAASQMAVLREACFCCSVTKSNPSLCNPMGSSMPGFAVLHPLLDSTGLYFHDQTHPQLSIIFALTQLLHSF